MYTAILTKSQDGKNKYNVSIFSEDKREFILLKNIKFGAAGYGDYTLGTTDKQKSDYIARHGAKEDWTKTGYFTAGFWSRWVLWNKRTIEDSIKDINKRFSDLKVFKK